MNHEKLNPTIRCRDILAALACLLLLGSACLADKPYSPVLETTGPAVTEGGLTRTPIRFHTKDDAPEYVVIDAEEGYLQVPERHGSPDGRKIRVHYVRFPSTTENPGPPIVYLAGGPGGSGMYSSAGDRFPLFQRLREVADVIAYDQRGVYGSEPYMVCPDSWSYPLDQPYDEATLSEAKRPFMEACFEHWSKSADLSAYNSLESAHDLDALRQALGAEKLTLWGISYGTHLAFSYLRAHPDRVHRAILAGIEGPNHTYKSPARIDSVVRKVAAAIEADPKARRKMPDFIGALEATLARLEKEPARIELRHPETGEKHVVVIGANDLRRGVYSSMGEREDIVDLLKAALPVLGGDLSRMARGIARGRSGHRELVMSLSMDCASGLTEGRRKMIEKEGREALLGDVQNMSLRTDCAHWPVEDLGDAYRAPLRSDVPVLFISGDLDIKTPPANAEDMLPGFPNGRHLVVEGGSHDDDLFLSSPDILESMVGFLGGQPTKERVVLPPLRFELP